MSDSYERLEEHYIKEDKTLNNFIEGLQILKKYMKKDTYVLQGEHDAIFVYTNNLPENFENSVEEIRLAELGFLLAEDIDEQTWRYYT